MVAHKCAGVNFLVYGVPHSRYTVAMSVQSRSALAQNIGRILGARRDELGTSNRQVALEAGVSHMTVNRAIDADTSISVDTLASICRALRLEPWRVLREAEDSIRDHSVASDPITYAEQAEAKLNQLLQSNYTPAAKEHHPDPYANLGEENQEAAT